MWNIKKALAVWGFVLATKNIPGIIGHTFSPNLQYKKGKYSPI